MRRWIHDECRDAKDQMVVEELAPQCRELSNSGPDKEWADAQRRFVK